MTRQRLVSVIIGTRNRPDTLRDALASIRALEGPDLAFEILVGDNGTTPEAAAVVAEFGGIYDKTDIYGCPAARNLAMRRMTGEFVAFLDDDDVWTAQNIRPHIAIMDAQPEIDIVFGQIVYVDQQLNPVGEPWPGPPRAGRDAFVDMLSGYFPQVGATVVRGDVARKYGLMDEALIGDSDWDWQLRITRSHGVGFTETPCVLVRVRQAGSFDKLQTTRVGYTQLIFRRHAFANLGRWRSPIAFLRSYFGTLTGYYDYFVEAAVDRAAAGDRGGARRAIGMLFKINPSRATKMLVRYPPLRQALRQAVLPRAARRVAEPGAAN